jgi:predicted Zn-ribbon and HTH transcriptional regulator
MNTLPVGEIFVADDDFSKCILESVSTIVQIHKGVKMKKKTTEIGYINRNRQEVLRKTNLRGNDNNQYVYVLKCNRCGFVYGVNGSDVWQRKCPKCQGGKKGLLIR